MRSGYSSGLFDCTSDMGVCCTGLFCSWSLVPTACDWAHSRGEECTLVHCCTIVYPLWTRSNIRKLNSDNAERYFQDFWVYYC